MYLRNLIAFNWILNQKMWMHFEFYWKMGPIQIHTMHMPCQPCKKHYTQVCILYNFQATFEMKKYNKNPKSLFRKPRDNRIISWAWYRCMYIAYKTVIREINVDSKSLQINQANKFGYTPLHRAIILGSLFAFFLLELWITMLTPHSSFITVEI